MELIEIYFNRRKIKRNALYGMLGVVIAVGVTLLFTPTFPTMIGCGIGLLVAVVVTYNSLTSISRRPQIVLSEEGLYVRFDIKKTIPWRCIDGVSVSEKNIDDRMVPYIKLITRIVVNAPSNILVREFPVEDLDMEPQDLKNLISDYIFAYKNRPVQS
jgi:hypothetical protein